MNNFKENLQTNIPLLPVHGTVLLPKIELPIPISDPDYLGMIYDCLRGNNIFGVVQPNLNDTDDTLKLFKSGCAATIIDIDEIERDHLLVTVSGLCRFDIIEEIHTKKGYRKAKVSFDRYLLDGVEESDFSFDRTRLVEALKPYFKAMNLKPNWKEINSTSDKKLISALTMICPLDALEKQIILETVTPKEQSRLIMTMIEMASFDKTQNNSVAYH